LQGWFVSRSQRVKGRRTEEIRRQERKFKIRQEWWEEEKARKERKR
jgi:hypothetical protein